MPTTPTATASFPSPAAAASSRTACCACAPTGVFGYALLAAVIPAGLWLTGLLGPRPDLDRTGRSVHRLGLLGAAAQAHEPRPGRSRASPAAGCWWWSGPTSCSAARSRSLPARWPA
ncbi:MAG: hypothetical protein MZW92_42955 [Comamonadaceae bacterium]|nr:hypothetical protein [Comamonadaceae bacterium]